MHRQTISVVLLMMCVTTQQFEFSSATIGFTIPKEIHHHKNATTSESWNIITSSDTADLDLYDGYFLDTTSNSITLTMPDLTGLDGRRFGVKRVVSNLNTASISMYSGQTIDGSTTHALIPATMNSVTCVIWDGDLYIIASH